MFKHISWSDYLTTVAIISTFYYLVIVFRFYLPDIKRLITRNSKNIWVRMSPGKTNGTHTSNQQPTTTPLGASETEDSNQQQSDDFDKIRHVCDQLSLTIGQCANESTIKGEFSRRIAGILQQYPPIKYSPFYDSINELIVSECGKHHYHLLSTDELKTLWSN